MTEVLLVRHALPVIDPDVPAELWRLGDDGRALARALPRSPFAVTSDEPKALQTARELVGVCGGTLAVDARVAKTRGPPGWRADFADLARRFVAGQQHAGWEPRDAVVQRFDAAVREALDARRGAPVVVVDHGQALTLWLHGVGALEDAPGFWAGLAFPDAWRVTVGWSGGALAAADAPARVSSR